MSESVYVSSDVDRDMLVPLYLFRGPCFSGVEWLFGGERKVVSQNSGRFIIRSTCMPVSRDALLTHLIPRKLKAAGHALVRCV